MNRRLMTMLLSAFVVAAGACWLVYRMVGKQLNDRAANQTVTIVVAARDLPIGTLIKAEDLTTAQQVGTAPKDAILKRQSAIGRGVIAPVYIGEPLSEKRLAMVGSGAGLAATIPPGMRACAVKVDNVVGVAGFAGPGMHVDVLVAYDIPGANQETKVRTLLEDIEVLSADKDFQPDSEGKPKEAAVVNLLVTPEQAELLSLANSRETRLQLVLRNPLDTKIANAPGTELASLFGHAQPPAPVHAPAIRHAAPAAPVIAAPPPVQKPEPPPVFVVKVMNAGKQTEQTFQLPGETR